MEFIYLQSHVLSPAEKRKGTLGRPRRWGGGKQVLARLPKSGRALNETQTDVVECLGTCRKKKGKDRGNNNIYRGGKGGGERGKRTFGKWFPND